MEATGPELPSGEHREWLLDGLSRLIRLAGWKHFVAAPILLPDDRHFPDAWEQGPAGVKLLLRRLLAYAGLGDHRVKLEIYREHNSREFDQHGVGHAGPGAAAWFAGIHADECSFGVSVRELRDVEELVGTLGHEVAHAFRYHHGLVVRDSHIEERLTDVTTVYLGFGVFLLNSSYSFKTGGYSESGERLLYETKMRGYLSPPELALLLGAQLAVRRTPRQEQKQIRRALAPNQAALLDQALESFEDDQALHERLGVPERSTWGELPSLEDLAVPLEPEHDAPISEPPPSEAPPRRALRVVANSSGVGAVIGGVTPFVLAPLVGLEDWTLLVAPFVLGGLGWLVGAARARDSCSACSARVARDTDRCEGCGAHLVDSVESREERLAAEERLLENESEQRDSEPEQDATEAQRMAMAMYTAWMIGRDLISAEFAEDHAELVVSVRCGEFPVDALEAAWREQNALLNETGETFVEWYTSGKDRLFDQDFFRLTTGVALTATSASYRRMADVLDARFAEWQGASPIYLDG